MKDNQRVEPRIFKSGHQNRVYQDHNGQLEGCYFIAGRTRPVNELAAPQIPPGPNLLFEQAIKLHDEGIAGNKEAVVQASALLQDLHNQEPANLLISGYLGSATALLGRDAIDPLQRMSKALEGLKILDQVVASSPDNIQLRTLRGYVSYKLPETYFHRNLTAVEDFSYLVSRYEQDPSTLAEKFYWQLLYDLGMAYKNLNSLSESEATWSKLLTQTTDPKFTALLRREGFQPALAIPTTTSSSAEEKKKLTPEDKDIYIRAKAGDKEATNQALALFTKAFDEDPGDNTIAAYYADSLSLKSREADPGEMFSAAIKAMKLLDQSVSVEPDNLEVRLTRAGHSLRLPEAFFKRTATAITDLEYLCVHWEKDPSIMSQDTYEQCLDDLGEAYQRLKMENEARGCWRKLLNIATNSQRKGQVTKKLSLLDAPLRRPIPYNKEFLFKEGLRLHDLAVAGNSKAAAAAFNILEKVQEMAPNNPLVQGYYASAMALAARESMDPGQMFGKTIQALTLLKKAISKDGGNPVLHLLRGYLTFSLPENFFHMSQLAIKDFKFVKNAYENDNKILPIAQYWQLLYDLGTAYQRTNNQEMATKVWTKLQAECQDPHYLQLLDNKLKG